ncbi:glycosyltransferase [Phenylobacterium immobile]|uniref:glycosyltransferase n=1 Tax=Phenylobacterium immobile TaxID=21 RepID=UPI000B269658|nr:glycosyltransferase [Phenylobacterium immobile]
MLYARWLFTRWPGAAVSVLSTPFGALSYPRARAIIGLDILEAIWGETSRSALLQDLIRITGSLGRPARSGVPQNAIYLNVGQVALSAPKTLRWLDARADVTPVFMLHDLIPVDHPEFAGPGEVAYFERILQSLLRARGLILNTHAVAEHPRLRGLTARRIVAPLPLSPAFLASAKPSGESTPYVLAYGEIEPRKNFAVLARAWRSLGRDSPAPRLLIVGAAGEALAGLTQSIDAWDPQRHRVEVRHGLSTDRLRDLIGGAHAVFAPSFAEGFGLAVAEALALGTPVFASDISAHREVGRTHASYLPPHDAVAWAKVALELADPVRLARIRAQAAGETPTTPDAYFGSIQGALLELALTREPTPLNGSDI